MINVGIVGLGFMAVTHIKAYRKIRDARIAAICNPSGRRLDGDFSNVAGNFGDAEPVRLDMSQVTAYRDYAQMLADPTLQLIDVCTPTQSHHTLSIQALQAGKHVICEKPLARTPAQAREIAAHAAAAKTYFMPAMCMRFWPGWSWLKTAIDAGTYGRCLSAHFRRMAEPPGWGHENFLNGALSGGALLDLHIHDADFVQFCFGRPRKVYSTGYTRLSGAIDHVVTQYEVGSGATVSAEGSWAMAPGFGFTMSYLVNFERATAEYDLRRGTEALRLYEAGQPARVVPCDGPDGFVGELTHLIEAIQTGRPPTIVTPADAVSAVEICDAEARSVETGQPVVL
ncbi:MAG: Gfo/Idh/MocA family oxidoreductase [Opitutaceae bacterium]|nr:Gfo/Idh/MocA family oxidoreductase [Opitutaceae bacterium]